ncbi:hypothetical protein GCK72_022758 [Caenorhabditis remanei]|uniref:Uncharacterized protein n=1 Tax=Caenorhabditis remanei TaxID=31234 RepID=A0A6A5FUX8_CAERE|nr:hypothetical protein GCK72_022758 [Caenorhabditis remanei]KAF1746305.1 hypothetical protein GCK72_022758 [Caenorhabditis remanei]
MRQFFVSQHAADLTEKDAEIEKQEDAKKRAQEKLRAERKNNEIFVAQNFKAIRDEHLQHFYQMLTTEMKGRGGVLWHLDVLQEEIEKLEKRNEDRSKRKKENSSDEVSEHHMGGDQPLSSQI